MKPLWTCPGCGRAFAHPRRTHTCARLELEHHFAGRDPVVRDIFEAFVAALRREGPVTVLPEKTRIAFQFRMSFAQLTPRKRFTVGHLVLARVTPSACFRKIETYSPRNHVHAFRLAAPADVQDPEFLGHLAEACAVGRQEHLSGPPPSAR